MPTVTATLGIIRSDTTGGLLEAWFTPDSGTPNTPGKITAQWRGPGDPTFTTFSSPYYLTDGTNPLVSDGNGFCLEYARDSTDRWWLTLVINGESATSHWWSASQGCKLGFTRFMP